MESSLCIARMGIDVFITKADSPYALPALQGILPNMGTRIHAAKST